MFTQLSRLQLLHDSTSNKYLIIQKTAFLDDLVNVNMSATSTCGERDNFDDAVKSFQNSFREGFGYIWKNRATCKPKKGSGLVVDLDTFIK